RCGHFCGVTSAQGGCGTEGTVTRVGSSCAQSTEQHPWGQLLPKGPATPSLGTVTPTARLGHPGGCLLLRPLPCQHLSVMQPPTGATRAQALLLCDTSPELHMTTECPHSSAQPLPASPKPGWNHPAPRGSVLETFISCQDQAQKCHRDFAMSAPAFQCEARSLSLPDRTPHHSSRDIRYIFLASCRNIPASRHHRLDGAGAGSSPPGPAPCRRRAQPYLSPHEGCHSSIARHLLAFSTLLGMGAVDGRGSPEARKRLPVFRQLCGEPVEEPQPFPAAPGSAKGWRIPLAAACPTCNKA
ncbi:hypothetical protein Nmel_016593, partial [Mimus melanotis]